MLSRRKGQRFSASWAGVVLALSCGVLAAAAAEAAFNRPSAFYPPGDPAKGAELAVTCLACHGAEARAAATPADRAPKLTHQRPEFLVHALDDYASGRRPNEVMAAIASTLEPQDRRNVAVYLTGERARPHPAALEGSPAHLRVTQVCGACHGETGLGVMEGYPILSGQDVEYLERALKEYRSGARKDPTMRSALGDMDAADDRAVAEYFAAQGALAAAGS